MGTDQITGDLIFDPRLPLRIIGIVRGSATIPVAIRESIGFPATKDGKFNYVLTGGNIPLGPLSFCKMQ
jgi:hypothetical protein